ncbi:hypothetical protein BDZ94DRAFT_1239513 [Collybia nuda]|uniref:Uncharacterized protein n=1 Tax=Collybia nuda TaxID=64659 RepID=A0A9P5XWW3_9AGAR|nr:hypothetical protein BDZ94DRAFT_1239513 [Collybia nuda]
MSTLEEIQAIYDFRFDKASRRWLLASGVNIGYTNSKPLNQGTIRLNETEHKRSEGKITNHQMVSLSGEHAVGFYLVQQPNCRNHLKRSEGDITDDKGHLPIFKKGWAKNNSHDSILNTWMPEITVPSIYISVATRSAGYFNLTAPTRPLLNCCLMEGLPQAAFPGSDVYQTSARLPVDPDGFPPE